MRHAFIAVALAAGAPMASAQSAPKVEVQQGGTTQRLQAVSPVSDVVVWASGTGGTFALTTDGGTTWRSGRVPGADSLEFRDVQGVSDRTVQVSSFTVRLATAFWPFTPPFLPSVIAREFGR